MTAPSGPRRKRGGARLYWRIWLAILATVALFAMLSSAAWHLFGGEPPRPPNVSGFAEIASTLLPPADAPTAVQQGALDHWHERLGADLALYAMDGTLIARTGEELEPPPRSPGPYAGPPLRPTIMVRLGDGRELLMRRPGRPPPPGPFLMFALIALAIAVGAYPVVRRLTRRLERLQHGVTQWGAGNLGARVNVEGRDEVAQLAASFNESAARIEKLVGAHRTLLANASHELRSPLARIRLGIELMAVAPTQQRQDELARDIAELDHLIDEILLASRLEAGAAPAFEPVDLTAVVAQECAHLDVSLQAENVTVDGNARLLHRMVRNLLENARRYGGSDVDSVLRVTPTAFELDVRDRGPGVSESERERVFEPFYRAAGASEASGGVGLGLALVRQIARQHGGDVHCLPRDGGGSIFRATLPREKGARLELSG